MPCRRRPSSTTGRKSSTMTLEFFSMHTGLVGRSCGSTALTRTTVQAEVNTTVASIMAHRFVIPPQTSLAPRGHLGPGCWWDEPYLSVASGLHYRLEDHEPCG